MQCICIASSDVMHSWLPHPLFDNYSSTMLVPSHHDVHLTTVYMYYRRVYFAILFCTRIAAAAIFTIFPLSIPWLDVKRNDRNCKFSLSVITWNVVYYVKKGNLCRLKVRAIQIYVLVYTYVYARCFVADKIQFENLLYERQRS